MRGFFGPGLGYAKDWRLSVSQDWEGPRRGELSASQERDGPGRGEPSRESQESRRDRDAVAEPSSSESSDDGREDSSGPAPHPSAGVFASLRAPASRLFPFP